MSQENVEIVRQAIKAFNERDVDTNRTSFRGRESVRVEARSVLVYTPRSGRIVKIRLYQERAEAFEALGLSEQGAHADS